MERITRLWYNSLDFPQGKTCGEPKKLMPVGGLAKTTPLSIQSRGHIIFPASGYRNNSNGSLNDVGSNGYCWSASANNNNNGRYLNFNSSNWNWNNNNRSYGYAVRAVAEAFSNRGLFLLIL